MPGNQDGAGAAANAANDINVAAIAKLPYYRGNSKDTITAHTWVDSVDRAANVFKWDNKMTASAACDALKEGASTWRECLQAGTAAEKALLEDWAQLKTRFLTRFSITHSAQQQIGLVQNLTQKKTESAADFYDRVDCSLKRVTETNLAALGNDNGRAGFIQCRNFFQKITFISGLEPSTRTWVEAQLDENTTLIDLQTLAAKAEMANRRANPAAKMLAGINMELGDQAGATAQGGLVAELAALREQFKKFAGGATPKTSTPAAGGRAGGARRVMPPMSQRDRWRACYRCKQWGLHIRDECRLTDTEIAKLPVCDLNNKPAGPAHDKQFPNC